MQVKLLRLLETGTYRRVGSTELRPCRPARGIGHAPQPAAHGGRKG
jgi:hypothetical protein